MTIKLRLLCLPLLAAPVSAQSWDLQSLVLEGDYHGGIGAITSISNLTINRNMEWRVEADTDQSDTTKDSIILGPAGVVAQEGQALTAPAGASIGTFDALSIDDFNNSVTTYSLDGTSFSENQGVYHNLDLLIQKGGPCLDPSLPAGTLYTSIDEAKVAANGDVIVIGSVDDPAISGSLDSVVLRLKTDGAGTVISETVLMMEGGLIPGGTDVITEFGYSSSQFDMNALGSVLFTAHSGSLFSGKGHIILDTTVLAEGGGPSPVPGRLWSSVYSPELSINNLGEYAYSGTLDGDTATADLLVKNGAKFRQEGDPVPGMPAFNLESFGSGPLDLADTGELLWYGNWSDPATSMDSGLFVGDELVIQEGVTTVGGVLITSLNAGQDGYYLSDDGRFVIFEATLANGKQGAFLATRSSSIVSVPGCSSDGSSLVHQGGVPNIGETLSLTFGSTSTFPGLRYLGVAGTSLVDGSGCGLLVPSLGEILIGFLPPDPFLLPMGVHAGVDETLPLPIPSDPFYVGLTLHLQGFFLYAGDPSNSVDMTNALEVTFGA